MKREFNVGDKVLLYRSHFRFSLGKLLSKWEGPYLIEEVYRSGAIKINNFEGTKPQVVNGKRLKHYMAGDPINVEVDVIQVATMKNILKHYIRHQQKQKRNRCRVR